MDANQSWYVIHSKPRKENQVYSQLQARAIETFYPTIRVKPVNPRSAKIRPYFPGYLFVRVDLDAVDEIRAEQDYDDFPEEIRHIIEILFDTKERIAGQTLLW